MKASASHILVEDHDQALAIKAEIDGGAEFGQLAAEHSKCPSGAQGGQLGTFGKGQMVAEFETVVFGELPVGQCSEPVKTQFGWHLIIVTERPAAEASARHILVTDEAQAKQIKEAIEGGADFAEQAAEHSQCPSGKQQGGALGTFGKGQMVPEFENVIFSDMPLGQISEPFKTQFGWHIVEVTERTGS